MVGHAMVGIPPVDFGSAFSCLVRELLDSRIISAATVIFTSMTMMMMRRRMRMMVMHMPPMSGPGVS
jgi:hypothetical protein